MGQKKTTICVRVDTQLLERARNLVYHYQAIGAPRGAQGLSGIIVDALDRAVSLIEGHVNGGEPFPERPGNLRHAAPKRKKKQRAPAKPQLTDEERKEAFFRKFERKPRKVFRFSKDDR